MLAVPSWVGSACLRWWEAGLGARKIRCLDGGSRCLGRRTRASWSDRYQMFGLDACWLRIFIC